MNKKDKQTDILSCTNQKWKVRVLHGALTIDAIVIIVQYIYSTPIEELYFEISLAPLLYGALIVLIRCPKCGSRWFWKQLNSTFSEKTLFDWTACPNCKKSCEELISTIGEHNDNTKNSIDSG